MIDKTAIKTWGVLRMRRWMRPQRRTSTLRRGAYRIARLAVDSYEAPDYDIERNGEAALLHRLARAVRAETVVDVGANEGLWYQHARVAFPDAQIFCVEIAPPLWPQLERRIQSDDRATVIRHGLGSRTGTLTLNYYQSLPAVSTTYELGYTHLQATTMTVEIATGDAFARSADIDRIDVLKVDVEGAELEVLRGFDRMFARGDIGVVQFEYGRANIVSNSLLRDFYIFLEGHGYVVGKVLPTAVDFRPYELGMEDFLGPNFVGCRPELVAACRGA